MKTNQVLRALLAAAAVIALGPPLSAATVNITDGDINGGDDGDINNGVLYGWRGGPAGQGQEDNEVEIWGSGDTYIIKGQVWDLEAFAIKGEVDSRGLYMIGGYNFLTGIPSGNYGAADGTPGDLFIKVGGGDPGYNPLSGSGTVANGTYYDYDYAVRLNNNGTATVYALGDNTQLALVEHSNLGSNPWKYASGALGDFTTTASMVSYNTGDSAIPVSGLKDDNSTGSPDRDTGYTLASSLHYVVDIDMSWLDVDPDVPVYFDYTMRCGNDAMRGSFDGGFKAPDGGFTLALLGFGLGAMSLVGRRLSGKR